MPSPEDWPYTWRHIKVLPPRTRWQMPRREDTLRMLISLPRMMCTGVDNRLISGNNDITVFARISREVQVRRLYYEMVRVATRNIVAQVRDLRSLISNSYIGFGPHLHDIPLLVRLPAVT